MVVSFEQMSIGSTILTSEFPPSRLISRIGKGSDDRLIALQKSISRKLLVENPEAISSHRPDELADEVDSLDLDLCSTAPEEESTPSSMPDDFIYTKFIIPVIDPIERYSIINGNAGKGSFGTVAFAIDSQNLANFNGFAHTLMERTSDYNNQNVGNLRASKVALKTFTDDYGLKPIDFIYNPEIYFILSTPPHPSLMQVYDIFVDNKEQKLHYSMEAMRTTLHHLYHERVKMSGESLSSSCVKSILSQILSGIRHIHDNNFVHRDLKPGNILVMPLNDYRGITSRTASEEDFVVKIADYGTCFDSLVEMKRNHKVGTMNYQAPEMLLRDGYYSSPIDMWAFGCIAYEIATGHKLFKNKNEKGLLLDITKILGTPRPRADHIITNQKTTNYNNHPMFGYWGEAHDLAEKMKFKFPTHKGINFRARFEDHPELAPLCEVIIKCLQWDPKERGTAESISKMAYFKGTVADRSHSIVQLDTGARISFKLKEEYTQLRTRS